MARFIVLLGVALLIASSQQNRGIRNNNWLNIKHNSRNNWVGQIGVDNKGYVIFDTPLNGLRAGFKTLQTYNENNYNTIEKIITRFAPPNENPTQQYINFVSSKTNIPSKATVTSNHFPSIIHAMTKQEVGIYPNLTLLYAARDKAFT